MRIVILSVALALGGCAKFSADDTPTSPTCSERSTFTLVEGGALWADGLAVKSARLGGDKQWYVSVVDGKGTSRIGTRAEPSGGVIADLANVNATGFENEQAVLGGKNQLLALQSDRSGDDVVYVTKRGSNGAFAEPAAIGAWAAAQDPYFVGNDLYVAHDLGATREIEQVELDDEGAPKGMPVAVTSFSGQADHPALTSDGLEIFVAFKSTETQPSTIGRARRASKDKPFGPIEDVTVTGAAVSHPTWVSADGCDLWAVDPQKKLVKLTRR